MTLVATAKATEIAMATEMVTVIATIMTLTPMTADTPMMCLAVVAVAVMSVVGRVSATATVKEVAIAVAEKLMMGGAVCS